MGAKAMNEETGITVVGALCIGFGVLLAVLLVRHLAAQRAPQPLGEPNSFE